MISTCMIFLFGFDKERSAGHFCNAYGKMVQERAGIRKNNLPSGCGRPCRKTPQNWISKAIYEYAVPYHYIQYCWSHVRQGCRFLIIYVLTENEAFVAILALLKSR